MTLKFLVKFKDIIYHLFNTSFYKIIQSICIFEQQLIKNKAPYTILEGSKQERLTHAIAVIDTLIKQKQ